MAEPTPFPSLPELRGAHRQLLEVRRDGVTEQFLADVAEFIRRGQATGVLLESDEDRWDAQNLLDYWSNELFHNQQESPDATLAEYDPTNAPVLPDKLCPYCGLDTFTPQQEAYFFGREEQIKDMLAVLANGRFLAITGPSGSGKSSTAQAGLLPRLQAGALPGSETWRYLPPLLPGPHPLASLAAVLATNSADDTAEITAELRQSPAALKHHLQQLPQAHAVLLIDQFEELFTLCRDEAERTAFLDNLLHLLDDRTQPHTLLITLRSDLDYHLARLPALQQRYGRSQVRLTPMGAAELRDVIEKPAQLIGLRYEDGLIDTLIRDVLGEPSALPLLQFTLRKLWDLRDRNRITWDAYQTVGSSRRAIAETADACYQKLDRSDRPLARHLLLQLVQPAPGDEIVRQRLPRRQLIGDSDRDRINAILDRFMKARLLRVQFASNSGNDQIELAHEALVTNWPRLAGWIEERRVQQRQRLQLAGMAEQWEALKRDDSALLRGRLLEEAQQYTDLTASEQAFVAASVREAERLAQQREWEQQRQIKQAEDLAEARRQRLEEKESFTRRLIRVLVALAVVSVLAIAAGLLATRNAASARLSAATAVANRLAAEAEASQRATAEQAAANERDAAEVSADVAEAARATAVASAMEAEDARATSEANANAAAAARATSEASFAETETQFRLATSRELAAAAANQLETDSQLALRLALEAIYITLDANQPPPVEARNVLYQALEASQLQRTFTGHTGPLTSASVSPDGHFLATGSLDGTVRLWDMATGQQAQQLNEHTAVVNDVAFAADGALLASADDSGLVIVWNVNEGNIVYAFRGEDDGGARAVAFLPDSARVLVGYAAGTVRLWELAAPESQFVYRLIAHRTPINDLALTADGAQFATASDDGTAVLWNTANGAALYSVTAGDEATAANPVTAVAFNPNDAQLLTGHADGLIRIWDGQTVAARLPAHTGPVQSLAFAPQGSQFASAGPAGTVKVWQADSYQVAYAFSADSSGVTAVRFLPDGERLVSAGADGNARLWRSAPGVSPLVLSGHNDSVLALAFRPDGQQLLSGSADQSARIWELSTGRVATVLDGHYQAVTDVLFPPEGLPLITASADANIRLWDSPTATPTFLAQQDSITAIALAPDNNVLAGGSRDGAIWLWQLDPPTRQQTLPADESAYESAVNALAFHPDGRFLAAGYDDGSVRLWELATGSVAQTFSAHAGPVRAAVYSPDGALLATAGDDGSVKLWDVDGALVRALTGHNGAVNDVAFHPDGSRLATASADRTVRLWDVASGQLLQTFRDHTLAVTAVAFSPDGASLATASLDRTIHVTALRSAPDLYALAWDQLTLPMSPEACDQYLRGLSCVTADIDRPAPAVPAP